MKERTVMFACSLTAFIFLLSGCAIVELRSSQLPDTDISELKSFYVIANEEDPGKVHENVRDALIEMGFESTSGPESKRPEKVDALVSYDDRWFWDITNYMIELNLIIRDPKTHYPLAEGESIRTSLARVNPKDMSKEILESIFKPESAAK